MENVFRNHITLLLFSPFWPISGTHFFCTVGAYRFSIIPINTAGFIRVMENLESHGIWQELHASPHIEHIPILSYPYMECLYPYKDMWWANFIISFLRPRKLWNWIVGHGKAICSVRIGGKKISQKTGFNSSQCGKISEIIDLFDNTLRTTAYHMSWKRWWKVLEF